MHDGTCATEDNMAELNDSDVSPKEAYFRKTVFHVLIYNVVTGLTTS